MSSPTIARVRAVAARGRRPVYGLAGQVLNAGTNVVTAYLASLLLAPAEFGRFVIAFAAVTIVLAAGRGLVGATMMVHLPALDEDARMPMVRSALGFTLLAGLGVSCLLGLAGLLHPVLWLFVPWVPIALLQDIARYVHLAEGRTGKALVLDAAWAVVQAATLGVGWLLIGSMSLGLVSCAWGLGALGGLAVFVVRTRLRPAHPRPWARATRDVAGWFTAVAVLGQVEVYLVLLLTGLLLTVGDVGGIRAVQLLAYQPPAVLLGAVQTVRQPAVVLARHSIDAMRAAWRGTMLTVTPIVAGLAVIVLLREPLMGWLFPQYVGFAPQVVPIAVQSTLVALMIPPLTVLNGLRRGSAALRAQLIRSGALIVAAAIGMRLGGVEGLTWGLVAGAALSCAQLCLAARRAMARTVDAPSGFAPQGAGMDGASPTIQG